MKAKKALIIINPLTVTFKSLKFYFNEGFITNIIYKNIKGIFIRK